MKEKKYYIVFDGYTQVGGYLLPDIELPDEPEVEIGAQGQRRLRYLKQHRRALYTSLLTSGKLNSHLAEINRQAEERFFRLVKQMAEREGARQHRPTVRIRNQPGVVSQLHSAFLRSE